MSKISFCLFYFCHLCALRNQSRHLSDEQFFVFLSDIYASQFTVIEKYADSIPFPPLQAGQSFKTEKNMISFVLAYLYNKMYLCLSGGLSVLAPRKLLNVLA